MKKDIENFDIARQKLENMFMNYKPGESLKDYGLGVAATTGGYRAPDFSSYADCTQSIINDLEDDNGFTLAAGLYQGMVGFVGFYTFGLHGLLHGTSAAEQSGLTFVKIEQARNRVLLHRLRDKYAENCSCFSAQNVVSDDLPRIQPPITFE